MCKRRKDVRWSFSRQAGACVAAMLLAANSGSAHARSADSPEIFASPNKAVGSFVDALRRDDEFGLLKILGSDAGKLIHSGDPVEDKQGREHFVSAYDAFHKLAQRDDKHVMLLVGLDEWPFPIPLTQMRNGWRFDTEMGAEEILNRRIGRNELTVLQICRAYVEAQREYAALHLRETGKREYAQKLLSSNGEKNGLYWSVHAGEGESPMGPFIAGARDEGYFDTEKSKRKKQPYHGYYYRILKAQGSSASGGAVDYVEDGHMTRGFALLAYPATYGDSGVMTFLVNHNGIVYARDLGPETATLAPAIKTYDPDAAWHPEHVP